MIKYPTPPLKEREEFLMLFTESQLQIRLNPFSILDEAVYLTESEVSMQPQMVSIVENSRLQAYVIDFNGIKQLAESTDLDYLDATVLVVEQEGIDPSKACIAIDEAELIESPELVQLGSIVVRPLSEVDDEFQFCLEAIDAYIETNDEMYLDAISEVALEDLLSDEAKEKLKNVVGTSDSPKPSKSSGRTPLTGGAASQNAILQAIKGKSENGRVSSSIPLPSSASAATKVIKSIKDQITAPASSENGKKSTFSFGGDNDSPLPKPSKVFKKISGIGHRVKKTVNDVVEKAIETPPPKQESESKKPASGTSGSIVKAIAGDKQEKTGMGLGTKAAIGAGIGGVLAGGLLAYRHYKDQPKSAIAKRIAALRQTYAKFMQRAQSAPNDGIKNRLKHVAAKILRVIDKLLGFLQRKADHR